MWFLCSLSKQWTFQCPYCKEHVVNLPRHLKSKKHNFPKELAKNSVNRWDLQKPYEYQLDVLKQAKTTGAEEKKKEKDIITSKECSKCFAVVKRSDKCSVTDSIIILWKQQDPSTWHCKNIILMSLLEFAPRNRVYALIILKV